MRDVVLPSTSDVTLNGEMYAYHEALYAKMSGRYQIPTRRNLQNGASAKAADYIRGRWALELMRRTIDDSFKDVDVVVLPTRRHTPRTVDAAVQREETDVPRNPELENTGQFNVYGIPAISVPCGFTSAGLPVGLMIAGPRFAEGPRAGPGPRLRAGHRWHTQTSADHARHAGAAAGAHERVAARRPGYWPPVSALASSATPCRNNWRICPLERKSRRISARRLVRRSPMT